MRYVEARFNEYNREEAYRIYASRSLQLIPQSKHLIKGYLDFVYPKEEDTRSGDEIVQDVMNGAGLRFEE